MRDAKRIGAGERVRVTCTVNGKPQTGFAEPRTLLCDFLRHELHLYGTHVGCEHGVCGACTVTLDGRLARSCMTFAVQAEGSEIGTVEGLSDPGTLNALQRAFSAHGALQCGFCTAGILISATHFLGPSPRAERTGSTGDAKWAFVPLHRLRRHGPGHPVRGGRSPVTLARMLSASVARDPDAIAIVEGDRRLSYAEWADEIARVAGGLSRLGLSEGDHLVAVLSNRYETASLFWACQMLGAVFTPFNWRATAADIAFVLEDAEAKLVVYEDRSGEAVGAALQNYPVGAVVCLDDGEETRYHALTEAAPFEGRPPSDDPAICLMLYTSGTTGRPKGVPRSHAAERIASAASPNCTMAMAT